MLSYNYSFTKLHWIKDSVELENDSQTKVKENSSSVSTDDKKLQQSIDWKPQNKCYFCVDGKLVTVNERGDFVTESGSVQSEPDLVNRVINRQIHIQNKRINIFSFILHCRHQLSRIVTLLIVLMLKLKIPF